MSRRWLTRDQTITIDLARCFTTPLALYVAIRIGGFRVMSIDVAVRRTRLLERTEQHGN